jgi:hypothetical protein
VGAVVAMAPAAGNDIHGMLARHTIRPGQLKEITARLAGMDLGSGLGSSLGASTGRGTGGHNSSLTRPGSPGAGKSLSRQNSDERPGGGGRGGKGGGGGGGAGNTSARTSPNGGSSLRPATTGGAGRSKNLGGSLPTPSNDNSMAPVPYGAATGRA